MQPGTFLDHKEVSITYRDFVNKELIYYARANVHRSIASMVDGLKPTQRKILFSSFEKDFVKEERVSRFSGYVSGHSAYHHGESLDNIIIGMGQDFMGSNNINLLQPIGFFGTQYMVSKQFNITLFKYLGSRLSFLSLGIPFLQINYDIYPLAVWERSCKL